MRIYLTQNKFTICLPFPTRFILNKPVIKMANRARLKYASDIPYMDPEDVEKLYQVIKSSKKLCKEKYGRIWDLVDAESATGQRIRIRL